MDTNNTLFIKNTNILTMDPDKILQDHDIVIKTGKISDIQPAGRIMPDKNSLIIDGSGKYVIPGLMDMHVHLGNRKQMIMFLANGITTVRNMWGSPEQINWQRDIENGDLLCPNIYTTSPLLDGEPGLWPGSIVFMSPEEVYEAVTGYKNTGYKQLKVYNLLGREIYDAIADAGRRSGMPVVGHVPDALGLKYVLIKKQYCIEHLDGLIPALVPENVPKDRYAVGFAAMMRVNDYIDRSLLPCIIDMIKQSGAWVCPTLAVIPSLDRELPWIHHNNPKEMENRRLYIELMTESVGRLNEIGAKLIAGTDTPNLDAVPGFSLHEELEKLVLAGLTPYEALRASTVNGAELMNSLSEVGTVSVGKRADLLLLNANPLDKISNTKNRFGLVFRGKWLPQDMLNDMLEEVGE